MRFGHTNLHIAVFIIFGEEWVRAQDYYEEPHKNQIRTQTENLSEIPKRFEIIGENALAAFNKYHTNIQDLAAKKKLTVHYNVRVDTFTKNKRKNRKDNVKKAKSKKFLVPLKKKNMKLSSFEIILRKRANDLSQKQFNFDDGTTTEKERVIFTTRNYAVGKYKPIIRVGGVRTNYAKVIRPVKNKIITLES